MARIDFDFRSRLAKIETLDQAQQLKQVFEWVKTGVINLKQFEGFITYIEHFGGESADRFLAYIEQQ